MPQSHARILVHLVFSTKDRRPFLNPELRTRLFAYLATILRDKECPALAVGGVADHVHLLFALSRKEAVADLVNVLKSASSKWIHSTYGADPVIAQFGWQSGYGVFSVSESQSETVRKYVESQETHHAQLDYQDEYRTLLKRHNQTWDERYLWD
jgi:putative transposase